MISTADFKRGARFEYEGAPYQIEETTSQSPSARGAVTLVRVKARQLLTGQLIGLTFKAGEKFHEPDIETRTVQYLYGDGDHFHFMDRDTFDQYPLAAESVGDKKDFLIESLEVRLMFYRSQPVALELPHVVELQVADCDPAFKGDTVTAATKSATLETGLVLQVPLFIEAGERIRVDTRDCRYIERAR